MKFIHLCEAVIWRKFNLKLVIIESPFKREALKKYLGDGYEVFATKGHIRDLPQKSYGLDVKNRFEPIYQIMPEKKELINELKKDFTIVIVTHNMQQATRVSDYTAFFMLGEIIEYNTTNELFKNPHNKKTEDYITGRFG